MYKLRRKYMHGKKCTNTRYEMHKSKGNFFNFENLHWRIHAVKVSTSAWIIICKLTSSFGITSLQNILSLVLYICKTNECTSKIEAKLPQLGNHALAENCLGTKLVKTQFCSVLWLRDFDRHTSPDFMKCRCFKTKYV